MNFKYYNYPLVSNNYLKNSYISFLLIVLFQFAIFFILRMRDLCQTEITGTVLSGLTFYNIAVLYCFKVLILVYIHLFFKIDHVFILDE